MDASYIALRCLEISRRTGQMSRSLKGVPGIVRNDIPIATSNVYKLSMWTDCYVWRCNLIVFAYTYSTGANTDKRANWIVADIYLLTIVHTTWRTFKLEWYYTEKNLFCDALEILCGKCIDVCGMCFSNGVKFWSGCSFLVVRTTLPKNHVRALRYFPFV